MGMGENDSFSGLSAAASNILAPELDLRIG